MVPRIIFALMGVAAGTGALLVHDHVAQAALGMAALVFLLVASSSRLHKKSSSLQEAIRLLLWP